MNTKALIPLVAGVVIAGVAAKLGLDFMKKAEGKPTEVVKLWTPTQDIKRGVSISESMVQPLEYPAQLAPPDALAEIDRIVGRVPHTGAPAGLPILDSMLLPPGHHAGVQVPPGLRAVAVKIDESSGVDNHLEPGCHVDVVGMFTVRGSKRAETVARTILEDVEVAAVGDRLAPSAPGPDGEDDRKTGRRERPVRAVTLLVKPEQVPTLHLAEQKGKIKLCMRGVTDSSRVTQNAKVDEGDLLGTPDDDEPASADDADWQAQIAALAGLMANSGQQPEAESKPDSDAPAGYVWVMAVQNGSERQVLAWRDMKDFQPTQLGSSGEEQNIFEDDQPQSPPQPTPDPTEEAEFEWDPQSEPEDLSDDLFE
jgi:pilus assembly protein CpaB